MKARLLVGMSFSFALLARAAGAGPWNVEPQLGVSADFDTNPTLRPFDNKSEEHVAALADVPLRYDADAFDFTFHPAARISNSKGYSSLASDYEHLDSSAVLTDDVGSASVQGGLARDSSLYYLGALVNGAGVRRDSASLSADWTRNISERTQLQFDAGWSETKYDEPPGFIYLTNYRYLSAGPTLSYQWDERDTARLIPNIGRYHSLDGLTDSNSANYQVANVRQLTEIWSLTTSLGYSQSNNREKQFFGPFLLGTVNSDQDGTVYSVAIARQGERLSLNASAARALQPSGFSYLSRQDSANFNVGYIHSERWDFAVSSSWNRARNPLLIAGQVELTAGVYTATYWNSALTANWHWTERWVISLHATHITASYGAPSSGASSGLSADIVRHFLRTEL